jgi:CDP-diacylglycerol--serine O-phosphatidyltransferase
VTPRLNLRERLIDPRSPERRPRRAAYALPTLFTAGNLFLGFLAILKAIEGALAAHAGNTGSNPAWETAAMVIGAAVFLDGLDGRIARLTNTTSEFGRELDSLADVISFGIAPAVLAFVWGFHFLDPATPEPLRHYLMQAGYFSIFLFVLCGACRLARFNITTNAVPRNPGRPDRKYFVGLPIPAAAAAIAAIVYASDSVALRWWPLVASWIALNTMLALLMISTWRYRSFKDFSLVQPRSPKSVVLLGVMVYLLWNFSKLFLLVVAVSYVGSGMLVRFGGIVRRHWWSAAVKDPPQAERPAG